jgi:signal transduction histidine kinase
MSMNDSGRHYTDADRALGEELARRASIAIEHAALYREAQAANAAKAQFLAVMSHELRTPLNAIDGYAELLELGIHGPVTDAQRTALTRIRRSQHHLLALVNDVLNFARLEAGQVEYRLEAVDVASALDAVVSMIAPQAAAKRITLTHAPGEGSARADAEKLQQIVLNLLSNAVKFTPEQGRITLTSARRDDRVAITVRDTGIGIPEDRLAAIFDPFVQLHTGLSRPAEGTGLGLAISRDLAHGMGGELLVASRLGEGAEFTLLLPSA